MNDRAQGGSADLNSKASIELMQHRRITEDDNKGAIEPLNETDSSGIGIKATATYYMQIFDYQHHRSLQRDQQEAITNPLQYFFAFKYKQSSNYKPAPDFQAVPRSPSMFLQAKDADSSNVQYQSFPMDKNKVLVRFENLADRFDTFNLHSSSVVQYVDV